MPPDEPPDDVDAAEWKKAPVTVLDVVPITEASEPITKPHEVLAKDVDRAYESGREQGCRTCYKEAQDEAIAAFESVFRSKGLTDDEVTAVVAAARELMTSP